ncbi:carboxypeptidase-like regulatory domain-containing protein [Tunturibacter empetritectus]|uniref:TonB-dependent transporter Oar-like beta-barrel domain-containing protein n=1 Tax=Tunturiibacter lichenicola TaxID=2051959 RepID=A0A7W8J7H1_9BACT|nr:carboxypeptidase-like regulatory domain-containing protein [Edaphobacter lichenicola]MBB5342717.1 hypothetical protein [Edaphobacter lichenicola]
MLKLKCSSFFLSLFASFAISVLAPGVHAQTLASAASLSGAIADPSGARVPNVNVTLTSTENGVTRDFKTDAEGTFSFSLVPPGVYTLTVEAPGFKTFKQQQIKLEVGQSATLTITLTVGATAEVLVTTAPPLLQTDNANIGTQISSELITQLPLNLRNVFSFVQLNSSVNNASQQQAIASNGEQGSADQDISFFNFGGGFFGTTAFLVDGLWDTSEGWGGVIYVPSPDNVQEFKVQQNSFTAQYGWSTGNVVNVVTKSGGSHLHGSVYEYLRNGALDANNYFNNLSSTPRPNSHRNQFGVAVGGPIYIPKVYEQRNKTFFFFNYEGHRDKSAETASLGTVPIPAFRSGDFSALLGAPIGTDALDRPILAGQIYDPFTTRQVTATSGPNTGKTVWIRDPISGNNLAESTRGINSVGQALVNYYPKPINSSLTNNWSASGLANDTSDEFSGRIDDNISDKTRIYGRFSHKNESKDESPSYYGASNPAGPGQTNPNNRWSLALGASQVFTPTFTMSVNLGGMKWVEGNNLQSAGFKSSSIGLPSFVDTNSPQFPVITVTNYESEGPLAGAGQGAFPRASSSGSVDFVKVLNAHQLSFGYMGIAVDENGGRYHPTPFNFSNILTAGPDPSNVTAGTGDSVASMLLGTPFSGQTGIAIFPITRTWFHGIYVQDDWKATSKFTLNAGIRWELQLPVTERHNRQTWFDYKAVNPISSSAGGSYTGQLVYASPGDRGLFNPDYKNFAPRVGFTYQTLPNLVVRGGFGIFYPPSFRGTGPTPGFSSDTPYVATQSDGYTPANTLSTAFSSGLVPVTGSANGGLTNVGYSATAITRDRKSFYVQQWMLGVQYALTPNDALEVTYVGNRGVHVTASGLNYNQIDPTKFFSLGNGLTNQVANPFYGHITSSGCNLDQPTVSQGQLLRPHPEFCDITEQNAPAGDSYYDALDLNYTHRVSQGLTVMASYTFSKFLDDVGGSTDWATASGTNTVRNVYNLGAERTVDATDTPQSFVVSYVYELPVGRGKKFGAGMNRAIDTVVGGWQTSGAVTLKDGFPLAIGSSGNGLNYFGVGQHVDVVGDIRVSDKNRLHWFNNTPAGQSGAAFSVAAPWTTGNAPRYFSNLRAPGYTNWDLSIQKFFPIWKEVVRGQFRVDMYNALNHTNYFAPQTVMGGGFGTITEAWAPRQMQAGLRLIW